MGCRVLTSVKNALRGEGIGRAGFVFFLHSVSTMGIELLQLHIARKNQVKVTNEELLGITALNSWKLVIGRVDQNLAALQRHRRCLPLD